MRILIAVALADIIVCSVGRVIAFTVILAIIVGTITYLRQDKTDE
jgi:hypothetical protein